MRTLSRAFRSIKRPNPNPILSKSPSATKSEVKFNAKPESESWCVYLILSTNHPIKTYVGVTTNFTRRLKQHNGELKGGAKASHAGRPWICGCIICGFTDRSEGLMAPKRSRSQALSSFDRHRFVSAEAQARHEQSLATKILILERGLIFLSESMPSMLLLPITTGRRSMLTLKPV